MKRIGRPRLPDRWAGSRWRPANAISLTLGIDNPARGSFWFCERLPAKTYRKYLPNLPVPLAPRHSGRAIGIGRMSDPLLAGAANLNQTKEKGPRNEGPFR